jgi:hypothetical protein
MIALIVSDLDIFTCKQFCRLIELNIGHVS